MMPSDQVPEKRHNDQAGMFGQHDYLQVIPDPESASLKWKITEVCQWPSRDYSIMVLLHYYCSIALVNLFNAQKWLIII